MNLKVTAIFIAIGSLLGFVPAETTAPDKMAWNASRKLSWRDFQGTPQAASDFVASTHSGMSFSYSFTSKGNDVSVHYTVASYFYPKRSWYKPKQVNAYILSHEQTHFDISELYARKLRKKISQFHLNENSKQAIEALYQDMERQRRELQQQYDAETDHSKNKAEELQWQQYITAELQRYGRWK